MAGQQAVLVSKAQSQSGRLSVTSHLAEVCLSLRTPPCWFPPFRVTWNQTRTRTQKPMELPNLGDFSLDSVFSPSLPTPVKLVTRVCFSTNSCAIFSSFQRLYFAFVTLKNYWHIIPRGPIQRLYISLGLYLHQFFVNGRCHLHFFF